MKQIFISDLHLHEQRAQLTPAFFSFLENQCSNADQLFILGDLFEVWLGDDDHSRFNEQILARLAACPADKYVMHGNRDFLLGTRFCRRVKATLLHDPTTIQLDAGPAMLMHGDSLCTRDPAYMAARKQFRSSAFQQDFLDKSLDERAAFARQIRDKSRNHIRETADDIMDVTPEEVVRVMSEARVEILIHGHTHRPGVHPVNLGGDLDGRTGHRYVLGDWHTHTHYLEVSDGEIALQRLDFA